MFDRALYFYLCFFLSLELFLFNAMNYSFLKSSVPKSFLLLTVDLSYQFTSLNWSLSIPLENIRNDAFRGMERGKWYKMD